MERETVAGAFYTIALAPAEAQSSMYSNSLKCCGLTEKLRKGRNSLETSSACYFSGLKPNDATRNLEENLMVNCIPENIPDLTCMSNHTSTKIFESYVEKIIYIS